MWEREEEFLKVNHIDGKVVEACQFEKNTIICWVNANGWFSASFDNNSKEMNE